jgi:hypothetical protein
MDREREAGGRKSVESTFQTREEESMGKSDRCPAWSRAQGKSHDEAEGKHEGVMKLFDYLVPLSILTCDYACLSSMSPILVCFVSSQTGKNRELLGTMGIVSAFDPIFLIGSCPLPRRSKLFQKVVQICKTASGRANSQDTSDGR